MVAHGLFWKPVVHFSLFSKLRNLSFAISNVVFSGEKKKVALFMQRQNKGTGEVNNTFPLMLLEFDVSCS